MVWKLDLSWHVLDDDKDDDDDDDKSVCWSGGNSWFLGPLTSIVLPSFSFLVLSLIIVCLLSPSSSSNNNSVGGAGTTTILDYFPLTLRRPNNSIRSPFKQKNMVQWNYWLPSSPYMSSSCRKNQGVLCNDLLLIHTNGVVWSCEAVLVIKLGSCVSQR